jgi:hypothetical protein
MRRLPHPQKAAPKFCELEHQHTADISPRMLASTLQLSPAAE